MTSRVEELQRMCDNINENGGLDSGQWHAALLTQIAQNLAVIADVMLANHKNEPQTDDIGDCNICKYVGLEHRCNQCVNGSMFCKVEDEPQTDCPWK